jgi:cysteine desulfurase
MKIYLDYNATTPISDPVRQAMRPFLEEEFGNPSSAHSFGQKARFAIDEARERVASLINAEPSEIIFTASGTESNNLALYGASCASKEKNKHIISIKTEHSAILRVLEVLETRYGHEVTYVDVDTDGQVSLEVIEEAIRPNTILLTFMKANNEIGCFHPIQEISKLAKEKGIFFHSDCVQALGKVEIDVKGEGVTSASFSGHKVGAPKGVGVLYLDSDATIDPVIVGGDQEQGRRAGTENVMGIVGIGAACQDIEKKLSERKKHMSQMRDQLLGGLSQISEFQLNSNPSESLPNTLNASFEGIKGETLLLRLDAEGIAVSAGSACASGSITPSHVLLAMGLSESRAKSAIRFSMGVETTSDEIETTVETVKKIVEDLKN